MFTDLFAKMASTSLIALFNAAATRESSPYLLKKVLQLDFWVKCGLQVTLTVSLNVSGIVHARVVASWNPAGLVASLIESDCITSAKLNEPITFGVSKGRANLKIRI